MPLPLYHVYAFTMMPVFMQHRRPDRADHQPARHPGLHRELRTLARSRVMIGVNTLYNALLNTPAFAQLRPAADEAASPAAWRCSARSPSAGRACRHAAHRRLRADRNLAGRHRQPARPQATGPAPSACRSRRPRWRCSTTTASAAPAAKQAKLRPRPAGDAGYWNMPEETAQVFTPTAGCVPATLASWTSRDTCRLDRPQEGHDRRVRVQGIPQRSRGRATMHPGVLEVGGHRRGRRTSGEAVKMVVVGARTRS